ncbi:MAG: hypothetical protein ACRYFX_19075 [Janthinobacterium lividum]
MTTASYPSPDYAPRIEHLGPHFSKVFLRDKWEPFHVLRAPDTGPPHSHKFGMLAHILLGGYVEDVYTIHPDGSWSVERHERRPGFTHRIEAGTIHCIVALLDGVSLTWAEPDPQEHAWHFFDFRPEGVYRSEQWNGPWEPFGPRLVAAPAR